MKKKNNIYISVIVVLLAVVGFLTYLKYFNNSNTIDLNELSIVYRDSSEANSECKIVEVKEQANFFQYSFDNGLTWNLDNKYLSCIPNETINIKIRNMDYKIIGEKEVTINSDTTDPVITIPSDLEVEAGSNINLLTDVNATDGNYDITNRVTVDLENVDLSKAGTYEISYTVIDDSGNSTTKKRKVVVKEASGSSLAISSIKFENSEISCYSGEELDLSYVFAPTNAIGSINVSSSNSSFIEASLSDNSIGKSKIKIKCKSVGTTDVKISSANGITASIKIKVMAKENTVSFKSTIAFDKTEYSCNIGDTIITNIRAQNTYGTAKVNSYTSNNSSVASISLDMNNATCTNCTQVKIKCNAKGTTQITSSSNDGITVTVNVTVNEAGKVSFDKDTYSCKVGEKVTALITTTNGSLSSYSSLDTTVAKLTKSEIQPKCINCTAVDISCLKEGNATINATSETGAFASATVNSVNSTIYFDSASYKCKAGQSINVVLRGTTEDNINISHYELYNFNTTKIFTYFIGNSHIGTAICENCSNINVLCLNQGEGDLLIFTKNGESAATKIIVDACTVENGCKSKTDSGKKEL